MRYCSEASILVDRSLSTVVSVAMPTSMRFIKFFNASCNSVESICKALPRLARSSESVTSMRETCVSKSSRQSRSSLSSFSKRVHNPWSPAILSPCEASEPTPKMSRTRRFVTPRSSSIQSKRRSIAGVSAEDKGRVSAEAVGHWRVSAEAAGWRVSAPAGGGGLKAWRRLCVRASWLPMPGSTDDAETGNCRGCPTPGRIKKPPGTAPAPLTSMLPLPAIWVAPGLWGARGVAPWPWRGPWPKPWGARGIAPWPWGSPWPWGAKGRMAACPQGSEGYPPHP
mmetsp:Transcript_23523/g.52871  ORF Transcript_23523/g.52871 Transcript_23523/m.52871 type:complete len:282 (-) Transcript_23523:14-859(-)